MVVYIQKINKSNDRGLPRLRLRMLPVVGVFSCLTRVLGAGEWKGLGLSKVLPVRPALGGVDDPARVDLSFNKTYRYV